MAMLDNQQQGWVPFEERRDCSQGVCTIYCPQWCYALFPPPPSLTDDDSSSTSLSPLAIAIIGILATSLLLIGYYTVLAKYCGFSSECRWRQHSENRPEQDPSTEDPRRSESWHLPPSDGLDEALIRKIEVRKYNRGEGLSTDCSVCLAEFRENESLRLLPECRHAFHLRCIDIWLKSHSNCPLCRANVVVRNPDLENRVSSGSDHERQTLVIVVEDPDLVGSGEESEEEGEVDDGKNEIEEEDETFLRRSVSLGSTCQGSIFPISGMLKLNREAGNMVGGGGDSREKSKDGRKGRSSELHRVRSHARMKRSVSSRRSCFATQVKEGKEAALALLGTQLKSNRSSTDKQNEEETSRLESLSRADHSRTSLLMVYDPPTLGL